MSLPVLYPGPAVVGQPLFHAYLQEVLGKKTSGRVLNVGAGIVSKQYEYPRRVNNSEYHSLEISADTRPTYVGDVRHMPQVPSEYYDWVIAIAVLEHLDDMPAAMNEITRVLKPGGFVYLSIPLHNPIHFDRSFNDYWRVTPFGMRTLIGNRYGITEYEYWGDSIIDPVSISIIAQKGANPAAPATTYFFFVDGGVETIDRFIDGSAPFRWSMPFYKLRSDGLEYVLQVRDFRSRFFMQTGISLTNQQADRMLFNQAAELQGHIVMENNGSALIRR